MKRHKATGQTCVGELRLAPLDIGFDLRTVDTVIQLPEQFASVGLDIDGETHLVEGTREEMVQAIVDAGYRIKQ